MKTRQTNRLFSLFLAMVMLMSLAIPALAVEDGEPEKELGMMWLDWNEEGQYYYANEESLNSGEGPRGSCGIAPTDEPRVIFYIWDKSQEKPEKFVVPTGGDEIQVTGLDADEIAENDQYSKYYVSLKLAGWNGADLTADGLTFHIDAAMNDFAFFSSQTFSQATYLGNEVNEEDVTNCTVYFGNSYAGTNEAGDHDKVVSVEKAEDNVDNNKLYTLTKVNDNCWKIEYKDVLTAYGSVFVNLDLQVRQPDGKTREDRRGIRIYHESAPELRFVFLSSEWNEKEEHDEFFFDSGRGHNTSRLDLQPGVPEYGILGYGGERTEEGFSFDSFTPVSVEDVTLPKGVKTNTVIAKDDAELSEYYVALSVDEKDKEYIVSYNDGDVTYELTINCRLPDIGVYTAPNATWDNWAGPWGFPFNPVLDNEYYIISTSSDKVHGRHLTDMVLSTDWDKENGEIANASAKLDKVSDGVYKLTLTDDALNLDCFHLELDLTWTDAGGNNETDKNRYIGNFDFGYAAVASSESLMDGTQPAANAGFISAADAVGKVTNAVTMKAGQNKVLYLYRTVFRNGGPIVSYMPFKDAFHSASGNLTLTPDENDYSKFTLSASKAGVYEIYCGIDMPDDETLKLSHSNGNEYTEEEWNGFLEKYYWYFDLVSDDGQWALFVSEKDPEEEEFVAFEEKFSSDTYTYNMLGYNDWGFLRITVTVESDSSSSGGGGGGGGNTSNTTTNPDGSTTTTTEDKTTGTVTETTKNPDGSQEVVETKKDGTVTTTTTDKDGNKTSTVENPDGSSSTTVAQKDGTTATVATDASGKTEAEVKLPAAVVSSAQKNDAAVSLPIPDVQATKSTETAPAVTVKTGSSQPVNVEIPTVNPNPGTVAVLVKADGTEEIIKTSVPTEDGVKVALPDGATVKIVDNSKDFADVSSSHWANGAVDFVSARGLFSGTSATTFAPESPMTRAMLMTVLARYDGVDTSGGSTWYEKATEWAISKGISDGSNPNSNISREQLAVMLWRNAGSPTSSGSLTGFSDAESISDYALEAMSWAVANGIINGYGDGRLNPNGHATRAEVAQMLKNYIVKI